MSATLKIGNPNGTWMKSTTSPRPTPGGRSSRSVRLPSAPPSRAPTASAQGRLPVRRRATSMATTATQANAVSTGVMPVPRLNAAPEL